MVSLVLACSYSNTSHFFQKNKTNQTKTTYTCTGWYTLTFNTGYPSTKVLAFVLHAEIYSRQATFHYLTDNADSYQYTLATSRFITKCTIPARAICIIYNSLHSELPLNVVNRDYRFISVYSKSITTVFYSCYTARFVPQNLPQKASFYRDNHRSTITDFYLQTKRL